MTASKLDYNACVNSQSLTDEVQLSISEDGLNVITLFNPFFIAFADIVSFNQQDYTVVIKTDDDCFTFSNLGNYWEAFYLELYTAFNNKVRKSLFIKGDPDFEAEGEFKYKEEDFEAYGHAKIQIYDDCVCLLPPDNRARRIPFAFMNGIKKGDFELALCLEGGEHYSFIRLGSSGNIFENRIKEKLRCLRQSSIDAARKLDKSLSMIQLNAIAAQMPQGVALPIGHIQTIAPSYATAIETKIGESRAAETYNVFKQICDPAEISVGMKSWLAGEQDENILWFIAPSASAPMAAVEFAVDDDTAAATFIYKIDGGRTNFIRQLNRAMEAIDFKREVISMTDDKLKSAEYGNYYMAVKRTASLRFIRASFAGRVIHSSPDTWRKEIQKYFC